MSKTPLSLEDLFLQLEQLVDLAFVEALSAPELQSELAVLRRRREQVAELLLNEARREFGKAWPQRMDPTAVDDPGAQAGASRTARAPTLEDFIEPGWEFDHASYAEVRYAEHLFDAALYCLRQVERTVGWAWLALSSDPMRSVVAGRVATRDASQAFARYLATLQEKQEETWRDEEAVKSLQQSVGVAQEASLARMRILRSSVMHATIELATTYEALAHFLGCAFFGLTRGSLAFPVVIDHIGDRHGPPCRKGDLDAIVRDDRYLWPFEAVSRPGWAWLSKEALRDCNEIAQRRNRFVHAHEAPSMPPYGPRGRRTWRDGVPDDAELTNPRSEVCQLVLWAYRANLTLLAAMDLVWGWFQEPDRLSTAPPAERREWRRSLHETQDTCAGDHVTTEGENCATMGEDNVLDE